MEEEEIEDVDASSCDEFEDNRTAKKESNLLKKRIIFLEGLLASNLENLTGC